MRRSARRAGRGFVVLLVGIAGTLALVPLAPSAEAAVIRSFTKLYSAQINGSIQVTGNTLMTCAASTTCTSARNGTSTTNGNNQFTMVRLDTDSDTSTTSSSTANVTLPAGATVAKAYLFWGASTTASGASSTIRFRTPAAGYQTLTSDGRDTQAGHYSAYRDVTDLVRAGGAGTYGGADIPLAFGSADQYAGWSLVVAVADPAAPLRDLSIFSGYASVSNGNPATASIAGFLTPPSGAVVSKVGMVVYEGDIQLTGDQFQINGVAQSDGSAGSTTNFFNSRISDNSAVLTNRNPADVNSLGTEAKSFSTTAIPNNATSANLAFSSTGDVYFPAALTSQIDLYAPTIAGNKTVTNLTRNTTAQVGDLLEYQMTFTNTGDDNATNSVLRDPLPTHVAYVPGSIQVTAGPNTGVKTDGAGDDVGEYVAAERTVRVRIGSGATATTGGTLAKNVATTVKFRAVLTDPSAGTVVDNAVLLEYRAPQIGRDYTYTSAVVSTPVTARADLALTKTASPASVVAGAPLTYTLGVTNNGENTATNTVVSDTLPADVVLTSATTAGGTCTDASGTVTCLLGDVPNGATRTIEIVTRVRPAFAGSSITNVATVSSDLSDPVAANNTASVSTTVTRAADVRVTKTVSPTSPVAGRDVTYTIAVQNAGPSTANAVNLADTLPTAFLTNPGVTASTTTGTCAIGGRTVACELGNVAPGATVTVTVVGRLDPSYTGGAVANTASATTTTPDPTPGNNTSTATFTPATAQADLVVDKTTVTNPVVPGRPVEYRVTVTNNGPSDAVGVVLADAVPSTITGVAATPSQGTCTTTVSCALGTVPAGSTATVTVTGVVVAGAVGTVTNSATVSSGTADPTPGNNTGSTSDTVQPRADVAISKTAGPAVAGSNVTYTVTVTNNGPSVARDVVVTDPVPAPLTLVSATGSQGTCTTPGNTARCALGVLPPGAAATMTIVVGTPADDSANGVVNTATVATSTTDPTPGNDTASHTLTAGAQADISLTKTAAPSPVVAGGPVTFTLTARNNGPSNAAGVSIVDTLPAEVVIGALPAGCSRSGQTVTCTTATLAAGNTFVVQVPGTVSAAVTPGTLTNTATASSTSPTDPSPANNTASSTTSAITRADLVLTKSGPARAVAGDVVEYTVTATNNGPSSARDVVVTDDLPDGTVLVSSPDCALQPGSTATAACAFGTVPVGGVVTTTLRVRVAASQADGSTVTNRAQVSSTTIDPTPGNNAAAAATVVDTRTDLAVTKTATPDTLVAGQEAVYTVAVTNNGPSDARTLSLVDTLPPGVTLVSATTPAGTCTGTATVTCERGVLAADATWTVTVRVLVGAGTTATQVNAVTVSSATPETTPADNSFQLPSAVTVAGDVSVVKTVQPTPVVPGRQVVFGLTAVNNGPSTTPGTVLTDPLPAGLSGATVTVRPSSAGACDVVGGTVTCALGALTPGQPVTATVTAILAPGYAAASLSNTATITSAVADPTPGNDTSTVTTPVTPEADLTVTKRADTATIVAGEPFEYTVEVGNAGPSVARDVVVTDQVPTDLTITSATVGVGGPACTVAGQQVTCSLDSVSPGVPAVVVIRVRPQSDLSVAQVRNTASATSSTADATPDDNTSTLVLPVATQADVRVVKTRTVPASGPVIAGSRVTWTVTVTNPTGPSTARGVVVDDAVNPALAGVTATGAGGGCSVAADNRVSCTVGRLGVGDSATVTISGIVPASYSGGAGGTLVNTATASSTTGDPAPGNNTSTVTDTVRADAGVSVTKTRTAPASGPIVPGRPVSWLVTITNTGPSVAREVTVSDDVADTLTGVTTTVVGAPAGTACQVGAANLVTCALGDLPVGSATVRISADVPAAYAGRLDNTVQVTAPSDTTPGDNSATSSGTTEASADVAVTKTRTLPTAGPVVPGQPVAWEVSVDNLGPSVAAGVTITDDVINALTGVTASATGGGTCTVAPGGASPNLVTCSLGSIAPSADPVVVTIRGDVPPSYTGTAGNTVEVDTTTPDPVAGNDTATVDGSAQPAADVSITKTRTAPTSGPVVPGSEVEWTVTVTNAGPSSATGVTLTDDVVDALDDVTATGAGATCSVGAGNRIACDLPDLAPRQSVSVVVRGGVPAGYTGDVDNTAVVASPTDTTPGNNTATSTATAQPQADVSITKTRTSGPVIPGRPVTWNIRVTNTGPSTARQVTVGDDVLDTLTGVQAEVVGSPAGLSCSVSTSPVTLNVVSCDLGALAVGGTATIRITGDVSAGYTGAVDNTATVASPTDTTPGNNTATSTGTAAPTADVSVTKTRTSGPVIPGRPVTWNIRVTSAGPSVARDVTLTDDALDDLTDLEVTGAPADACAVTTANTVSCDLGDLQPGATATAIVTATVPPGYTGAVDNTATVASPTDTTPDNNQSTSTGTAAPTADVSVTKTRTSGPVIPGRPVTWNIRVSNAGPSVARDVTLTDDALDALTDLTATGNSATCDTGTGNAVTCDLDNLQPGATTTITITGALPAGYTGAVDNTATVTSPTDTTPDNNTATSTGTAQPQADVTVTKTRTSGPAIPGRPVTWNIRVTNAGPSVARDVVLTDDALDDLTDLEVTGAPADACAVTTANTVSCDLGDLTASGPTSSITITITGALPAGYTGAVDNTATVTSPTDTTPDNNTATSTGTAQPQADITVTKTRTSGPVIPGRPVTWNIRVTNAGPSVARDVTLTDDALDALTDLTAAGNNATCDTGTGNAVTCDLDNLQPGATTTITITGALPAGYTGAVDNTATVTSPTDTTPDNNTATSTGTAQPQADVTVTKTRTSGAIVPGRPVTWNIRVTNAGPSVARDVTLTDDALDALTDLEVTGAPADACTVTTANTVSCDLGDLQSGATATAIVTATVPPGYTGAVDNTATVASPTDTTPDNNTATSTGTAAPQADIAITKTRTSGPVIPGQPLAWRIAVTNGGPSTARDVVVTDDVLDALTGIDVQVTGAAADVTCTVATGNVVTCPIG
ncbi:DUF11 domain-containing protein, partial [Nocardioides sp. 1609]|uniref:DUF7507 domain-containing protein n=1 Tax=Nocardioides sp. 1609 TaxID=2508327 RepID=UPI00106F56D2